MSTAFRSHSTSCDNNRKRIFYPFTWCFRRKDTQTNEIVAIKVIDLEESEDDIAAIRDEITMLSACDSPQIVRYQQSECASDRSSLQLVWSILVLQVALLISTTHVWTGTSARRSSATSFGLSWSTLAGGQSWTWYGLGQPALPSTHSHIHKCKHAQGFLTLAGQCCSSSPVYWKSVT
jgi:hypothetical protein